MSTATAPADNGNGVMTLENLAKFPEGQKVYSCMQCGTCAATCPYGDDLVFPPRAIITMLQAGLIEEVFASPGLLNCVTCYACMAKCPRGIKLTEVLLPLVKEQVFTHLKEVPAELQKALENTMRYGNPMGESPRKRALWAKSSPVPVPVIAEIKRAVDVLWFVECYPAYHPRGHDGNRATARLFKALGIDFAILGNEEKCAGECVRMAGETGLFEMLTDANIKLMRKYKFNRIVTGGAHAYDALKHKYPAAGGDFEVHHSTPFFAQHLAQLKPKLTKKLDYTVTYHDACALGRHNGFYEEPRALLQAIPGVKLVEMTHNGVNSICCGGGGGGMWLDTYYAEKGCERLSERRVKEALETGANVLAVSCPYEISRFEDALKVAGGEKRMVVRDVVELLAEALED